MRVVRFLIPLVDKSVGRRIFSACVCSEFLVTQKISFTQLAHKISFFRVFFLTVTPCCIPSDLNQSMKVSKLG